MNISISSDLVVWLGAIAAMVGAIAGVYTICRARAQLKVLVSTSLEQSELIDLWGGESLAHMKQGSWYFVKAINKAHRAIEILDAEYTYKGKTNRFDFAWRPESRLEDGETAVTFISKDTFGSSHDPSRILFSVRSTTGRVWSSRIPKAK
jgi:hypothetical protein